MNKPNNAHKVIVEELLEQVCEALDKMKRTDETQMSDDHIYDEALEDAKTTIKNLLDDNK